MYSQLGLSIGEHLSDLFTSTSRQLSLTGTYSKILHITILRVYWGYSWEHFFSTANVWAREGHCISRGVPSILFLFFRRECLRRFVGVSTRGIIVFPYVRTILHLFCPEHGQPRRQTTLARSALGAETTDTDTAAVQRATRCTLLDDVLCCSQLIYRTLRSVIEHRGGTCELLSAACDRCNRHSAGLLLCCELQL